jgi:RimJ/RimL family protein N-acetyltransferase
VTDRLEILTDRLRLRDWRQADRAPYAAMMADPMVGDWLGATLTEAEAVAHIDRLGAGLADSGFGLMALERRADGVFLGAAGLAPLKPDNPIAPGVEIGWRLARAAWGRGYASEAAAALLAHGFDRLELAEIVAFTATGNLRSRAVMARLGMTRRPDLDFEHPALSLGHALRPHVVYLAKRVGTVVEAPPERH